MKFTLKVRWQANRASGKPRLQRALKSIYRRRSRRPLTGMARPDGFDLVALMTIIPVMNTEAENACFEPEWVATWKRDFASYLDFGHKTPQTPSTFRSDLYAWGTKQVGQAPLQT
ncbi:hypothetical protein QO002_006153 [Pararhizobium capsulatum DSM 1112]|uniref:Uncharacterized protein n=1 Tax=Pararhizobium capsulatum DSM 1112 TaxID=1121113 RepID=A0ABU0C207_9HYPH|nr:hypothetical protein [Pararhizobium capsulatum]MDQ0323946.1 hypothetical protein [Pararhizobium capsulatum DSM 1112]